jgi:hypothetical protein
MTNFQYRIIDGQGRVFAYNNDRQMALHLGLRRGRSVQQYVFGQWMPI